VEEILLSVLPLLLNLLMRLRLVRCLLCQSNMLLIAILAVLDVKEVGRKVQLFYFLLKAQFLKRTIHLLENNQDV
jgi:hypothetical protein